MAKINRQCSRMDGTPKKRLTQDEAEAQANTNALENAYQCSECGSWHVGHRPGTTMRQLLNLRLKKERG